MRLIVDGDDGTKLTLLGCNTYTGGTTIACMVTLQLGDGGTNGSIEGDVTDNGTLAFNPDRLLSRLAEQSLATAGLRLLTAR